MHATSGYRIYNYSDNTRDINNLNIYNCANNNSSSINYIHSDHDHYQHINCNNTQQHNPNYISSYNSDSYNCSDNTRDINNLNIYNCANNNSSSINYIHSAHDHYQHINCNNTQQHNPNYISSYNSDMSTYNSTTRKPCTLCIWSDWIDKSYPSEGASGDYENITQIKDSGVICMQPVAIECRAKEQKHLSLAELGQKVECSLLVGLNCKNEDQFPPICYNYEIRVKCCDHDDKYCETSTVTTTQTTLGTSTTLTSTTVPTTTPVPSTTSILPTTITSTSTATTPSNTTLITSAVTTPTVTTTQTTLGTSTTLTSTTVPTTTPVPSTTSILPTTITSTSTATTPSETSLITSAVTTPTITTIQTSTTATTDFIIYTAPPPTSPPTGYSCTCKYLNQNFSSGSYMYDQIDEAAHDDSYNYSDNTRDINNLNIYN
ncbi:mucin-2-like [Osmerus mordax]|uniref:mucin-2-like n=1 Tax=Osmerus mordax TaxID=8014 RepID=UPI00350F2BA3